MFNPRFPRTVRDNYVHIWLEEALDVIDGYTHFVGEVMLVINPLLPQLLEENDLEVG